MIILIGGASHTGKTLLAQPTEKASYRQISMGVVRSTYLINEEGIIEKVMPKVKPDTNAEEILAYLGKEA